MIKRHERKAIVAGCAKMPRLGCQVLSEDDHHAAAMAGRCTQKRRMFMLLSPLQVSPNAGRPAPESRLLTARPLAGRAR